MTDKLQKLKNAQAEIFKGMQTESKKVFKEAFEEIFEKYPAIETVSWTQYTPHFNDGDTCEFSVNTDVDINGEGEWDSDQTFPKKMYNELSAILQIIPEEVLYAIYGDHKKITVDRKGITVEEYQHD